jgi:UDP-N-acetylglucosamine 2-epimerase (non-hydrolysing)
MKIATIVGARPQFIKAAALTRNLREFADEIVVHTGQHYDYELSRVFFETLDLPEPDYNLGVGSGTHAVQTARMLSGIEEVLVKERPRLVVVHGDTNSTLSGSLAAAKIRIPIAHIEAGLRCFNRTLPEEVNRVLTDHLSELLFCPTRSAVDNLESEGISAGVHLVGDVMRDMLEKYISAAKDREVVAEMGLEEGGFYLMTLHRPQNTEDKKALGAIMEAASNLDLDVVFPAHPRTTTAIERFGLENRIGENVKITDPMSYTDFLAFLLRSRKVLTDSGGIQKEAYLLERPCVTLREETEWPETVEDGWNVLVGADKDRIVEAVASDAAPGERRESFGDGRAAEGVADIIQSSLN